MQKNRKYYTISLYALGVGAILLLFAFFLYNLDSVGAGIGKLFRVLSPFFIGFFIAYLLHGPIATLEKWMERLQPMCRWKRSTRSVWAVIIVYVLAVALVALLGWIVLPEVFRTLGSLIGQIQTLASSAAAHMRELMEVLHVPEEKIQEMFASWDSIVATVATSLGNLTTGILTTVQNVASGAFDFLMGVLASIYMVYNRERFSMQVKKFLYAILPTHWTDTIVAISRRSNQIFSIYLYVRILSSLAVGILTYVVLVLLGYPYALLISVIAAICNFVPIFGPIIGTVVCCILLVAVSPAKMLWYIVISTVIQQAEGNILSPKLMGSKMGLPAFWVLVGVVVGGGLFGIPGMILGVPAVAVIYALVSAIVESLLKKKELDY